MRKIKKCLKILGIAVLILGVVLLVSIWASKVMLSKTVYEYRNEKLTVPIRAVQLTDLHNSQFGKENERLVSAVRKAEPDVIFLTGDMLNDDEERTDIVESLIQKLSEIAPVYASLGNHEKAYMEAHQDQESLIELMENAGAAVLEQEYVDTEINGQEVRIGGLYGYVLKSEWEDGPEQEFMRRFEDTDRFRILLSHMPEGLLYWESMKEWDADLIFSGHLHGGQIRVPFVGGLYSAEAGFFPKYTKGMYDCGYGTMILSAGLGSESVIPRMNNLPEIVVCEILPALQKD